MAYDSQPVMAIELRLRRLILALLTFGLVGLGAELVAIGHYEDSWQLVPIGLLAATLLVIVWHVVRGAAHGLLLLQVLLVLVVVAGLTGIFLHYQANAEFQREMDSTIGGWLLFTKVIHAIAPPALAPGVMSQLGLLGLIYTYKHPASRR